MPGSRGPLPAGPGGRVRICVLAAAGIGGAALLRRSLAAKADSRRFYALTAGLAATWTASALLTTAVPVWPARRRSLAVEVAQPALTGAATFALFYAAAAIARRVPFAHRAISSVLHYVDEGATPAVLLTASVNAAAEELFFRGALWESVGEDPIASTTLAYTAVTAATGNPALAIGGAITGIIFGRERARSGAIAAPVIAHVTWSALMLTCLPPLFRPPAQAGCAGRDAADPRCGAVHCSETSLL